MQVVLCLRQSAEALAEWGTTKLELILHVDVRLSYALEGFAASHATLVVLLADSAQLP